jgi:hypothetical protein
VVGSSVFCMTLTAVADPGPFDGPGDVFGSRLGQVRGLLDDLADAGVWSLDDARLEVRLGQALAVRAGVDEVIARLVGQVDDRDLARTAGASSTQAYLMARLRMSRSAAAETLAQARSMTDATEPTRTAWAAGEISAEQAHLIGRAVARLGPGCDPDAVERGQHHLIGHAQTLSMAQLHLVANRLVEVVDPDGADQALAAQLEAEETRARHATVFRGRRGPDGIARFTGKIPNLHYDMLTKALDAITSPRRPDNQPTATATPASAEQPQRLGYGQRLGLAFCDLIEHLPTSQLPQHGVANATLVVTIDETRLRTGLGTATLDTGATISAGQARRLACNAAILPIVLGGDSAILDLGTSQRLFNRHQRLALATRDHGCIWPSCDRPPAWCEAHHTTPWNQAGPTNLANGCLLCPYHHHLLHTNQGWTLHTAPDGITEVIPPPSIDPRQQPTRHERYQRQRQ